ncbi:MAG: hypothetical protein ACT4OJ_01265 [Bacteroidota bacterium]
MGEWPVNESNTEDLVRKINTLLRVHMRINNPDTLSDDEWAMRWQELKWASKAGFLPFEIN